MTDRIAIPMFTLTVTYGYDSDGRPAVNTDVRDHVPDPIDLTLIVGAMELAKLDLIERAKSGG